MTLSRFQPQFISGTALSALISYLLIQVSQQVIGSVNTMLSTIYPIDYAKSDARKNVSSIAFAGTVVGQLAFGVLSDYWSRKWSLMISTCILILFAILGASSYGAGGSIQ